MRVAIAVLLVFLLSVISDDRYDAGGEGRAWLLTRPHLAVGASSADQHFAQQELSEKSERKKNVEEKKGGKIASGIPQQHTPEPAASIGTLKRERRAGRGERENVHGALSSNKLRCYNYLVDPNVACGVSSQMR